MQTRAIVLTCGAIVLAAATVAAQTAPAAQGGGRAGGRGAASTPGSCGPNPATEMKFVAKDSRCFELRTYTVKSEGPGSADVLNTRFREATLPLFKKHGIQVIGFWQPVTRPDTLIYVLAYKDAATRDAAWAAFLADPEWVKARTALQVAVAVQSEFMVSTAYGPLK